MRPANVRVLMIVNEYGANMIGHDVRSIRNLWSP